MFKLLIAFAILGVAVDANSAVDADSEYVFSIWDRYKSLVGSTKEVYETELRDKPKKGFGDFGKPSSFPTPFPTTGFPTASPAANCDPAEASGYTLVSKVYIPQSSDNWDTISDIPASSYQEGSSTVPNGDISRVAYCIELNNKWVWTSFDHTDRSQVGIPVDYKIDGNVNNLNVYDSEGKSITGSSSGKVEFWDECYGTSGGDSSVYDHDDSPSSANCYGSMQVHDGTQTEFGFNGWSHGSNCDITIGTSTSGHKDGTFNQQCNNYQSGDSRSINTYVLLPATP